MPNWSQAIGANLQIGALIFTFALTTDNLHNQIYASANFYEDNFHVLYFCHVYLSSSVLFLFFDKILPILLVLLHGTRPPL